MTALVPSPLRIPQPVTVRHVRQELSDSWTLELDGPEVRFTPGQFNMLYLPGIGEIPISVSGPPDADCWIHTIRAVGRVSEALCRLTPGSELGLRGPFGTGWPMHLAQGKKLVIIAGGIGLAPLRPTLYEALADPSNFSRINVLYGARSPEDILYTDQLAQWQREATADIRVTVDHTVSAWSGPVGTVPSLITPDLIDPINSLAFICGPEIMMRFSAQTLIARGLPDTSIFVSMERNMHCALGHCGHCQLGPDFVCKEGPVFRYDRMRPLFALREV